MSRILSIDQAAAYAGVRRRTVLAWIADGKVALWRTPSGHKRLRADQVLQEVRRVTGLSGAGDASPRRMEGGQS